MPHDDPSLPDFVNWPTFPFEGDLSIKALDEPVAKEPPRQGESPAECSACQAPDDSYIWVSSRWRVRGLDRPTGLPVALLLETRSHLDLGDLPNLVAAELGVMIVRLERAIRSLDGVARVHVNRWGDGSAHLHLWFLARPYGQLQLRGTFLSLWDDILPPVPEAQWRANLALVAAWLGEFGGRVLAEPPPMDWQASLQMDTEVVPADAAASLHTFEPGADRPSHDADVVVEPANADTADPASAEGEDLSVGERSGAQHDESRPSTASAVPTPRDGEQE